MRDERDNQQDDRQEGQEGWDGWEDGGRNLWWDAPAEGAAGVDAADAPDASDTPPRPTLAAPLTAEQARAQVRELVALVYQRARRDAAERDRLCHAVAARATELARQAFLLSVGDRVPWEPGLLDGFDVHDAHRGEPRLSEGGRVGELGRAADALLIAQAELVAHLVATGTLETTWRALAALPRYGDGLRTLWLILDVFRGSDDGFWPDLYWTPNEYRTDADTRADGGTSGTKGGAR